MGFKQWTIIKLYIKSEPDIDEDEDKTLLAPAPGEEDEEDEEETVTEQLLKDEEETMEEEVMMTRVEQRGGVEVTTFLQLKDPSDPLNVNPSNSVKNQAFFCQVAADVQSRLHP